MGPVLFYQLMFCAINMAIFLVALHSNGFVSLIAFTTYAGILSVLIPTFIYCYLSDNLATDTYSVADIFYGFHWYRLPVQQQRLFTLIIRQSQKELRVTGFGVIDCSLAAFAVVNIIRRNSKDFFLTIFIFFMIDFLVSVFYSKIHR